jgi:hypothetical protein
LDLLRGLTVKNSVSVVFLTDSTHPALSPIVQSAAKKIGGKKDQLLAAEMGLQPDNGRISAMHRKPEQPPASLVGGEVTTILVLANLVDRSVFIGTSVIALSRPL